MDASSIKWSIRTSLADVLFGQAYFLQFDPKLWEAGQPYAPLGTLYAASAVRARGYTVALFDAMADEGIPIVRPLAERLRSLVWQEHCAGAGNRCDRTDLQFQQKLAQSILWAVHDLVEYKPDPVRGMQDFVSRVGETLRSRRKTPRSELTGYLRGQGDCEDMSILFVALARALGFRANTMWIQQDGAFQNHVAATVYIPTVIAPSGAPMWAETTIDGARIGEHPWVVVERLGHTPRVFGGQP